MRFIFGDPEGSRTPVSRVRTWCPRPLNDGVTLSERAKSTQIGPFCQEITVFRRFICDQDHFPGIVNRIDRISVMGDVHRT